MDQKRTLWIVAAVGVFLLVVFGAAAILYSPAAEPARTVVSAPSGTQSGGWVTPSVSNQLPLPSGTSHAALSPIDTPSAESAEITVAATNGAETAVPENMPLVNNSVPTHVADMTVISQNTTVYGIPQYNTTNNTTVPNITTMPSGETTIDLNAIRQPSANVTATNQAGAAAIAQAKSAVPTVSAAPTASTTPTVSKSTPSAPAPAVAATPKAATKPAPKPAGASRASTASVRASETKAATTQYWVQAASFTSKKSADNAVVVLDDNKIPANIFTYQDAKGTLYYRIRVGPYVTKSEAEYWQSRITNIDTFASTNSYVTTTTSSN